MSIAAEKRTIPLQLAEQFAAACRDLLRLQPMAAETRRPVWHQRAVRRAGNRIFTAVEREITRHKVHGVTRSGYDYRTPGQRDQRRDVRSARICASFSSTTISVFACHTSSGCTPSSAARPAGSATFCGGRAGSRAPAVPRPAHCA